MNGMDLCLNGLDLFSGIGGLALALAPWVKPIAYCEIDPHAQAVLLSRMAEGQLPIAPVWDDVRTLHEDRHWPSVDIITGGFPCQDVSQAGARRGLGGERSGLYREVLRLVDECSPAFAFLENVTGLGVKGVRTIAGDFADRGFVLRAGALAASEIGAPHIRNRVWLFAANPKRIGLRVESRGGGGRVGPIRYSLASLARTGALDEIMRDAHREGKLQQEGIESPRWRRPCDAGWWAAEPDVGRVAHGVSDRVDRLRGLGNAVVPKAARIAFEILSGIRGAR